PESVFPALDHNRNRAVGEFRGKIGTEISRVFDFPFLGLEKLRHTIEPEIHYLYVPDVGNQRQAGRVASPTPSNFNATTQVRSSGPVSDELAATSPGDFPSSGATTRLFGRGAASTHPQTHEVVTEEEDEEDDENMPGPAPEAEHQKDETEPA